MSLSITRSFYAFGYTRSRNCIEVFTFIIKQESKILKYTFKNLLKEMLASTAIKISSQFRDLGVSKIPVYFGK